MRSVAILLASTQYVYLTGRMMVLVPPMWVLYTLLANRTRFKSQFFGWVTMGVVAFLLVLPNLILFVTLPESFSGRVDSDEAGTTGLIWETSVAENGQLLNFLGKKLWLMFRSTGIEWIDPLLPMDTPIFTPLFFIGWIIGIFVALRRFRHVGYGLLLIAMPLLLLGDLITSAELNPTPMRQTQVLPVYYALSGIGLVFLMELVLKHTKGMIQIAIGIVTLIIAVVPTIQGFNYYINVFVPEIYADPETAWRISQTDIDISNRLVSQPEQSYLLPYGEYTRKTTAWLTLAGFPERHSAIGADNRLNIDNLPSDVLIIQATDPDRARLDRAVGLNYIGWWVLLHDGQTILLPPLDLEQQDIVRDAITEDPAETIIDASGQIVASLYSLSLPDEFFLIPEFTPVDATIGKSLDAPEVRLLGYTTSPLDPVAMDAFHVSLYWQPLQRLNENYELFVQLWDDNATVYGESHTLPYDGTYRTRVWYPDEITVTHHVVFINTELAPQRYSIATNFYRILHNERLPVSGADAGASGDVVVLDDFRVAPQQASLSLDEIEQSIQFGEFISVEQLELSVNDEPLELFGEWEVNAGDMVDLRMQMDVLERLPFDYSYFIHLTPVDAEQPAAQVDQALGASTLPSGAWRADDTWFESIQLGLPDNLEAGVYDVWIGIYYYADGSRLTVSVDDEMMPDNRLRLGQVLIE